MHQLSIDIFLPLLIILVVIHLSILLGFMFGRVRKEKSWKFFKTASLIALSLFILYLAADIVIGSDMAGFAEGMIVLYLIPAIDTIALIIYLIEK